MGRRRPLRAAGEEGRVEAVRQDVEPRLELGVELQQVVAAAVSDRHDRRRLREGASFQPGQQRAAAIVIGIPRPKVSQVGDHGHVSGDGGGREKGADRRAGGNDNVGALTSDRFANQSPAGQRPDVVGCEGLRLHP